MTDEQRLVRAWRQIKSRPVLLPLSWFQHVDDLGEQASARERLRDPAAASAQPPRRSDDWGYARYGRALGMLAGGALGDALGALGPAPADQLLTAARSLSGTGFGTGTERTALLLAGAEAAIRVAVERQRGVEAAVALPSSIARGFSAGTGDLGAFAVSVPVALASLGVTDEEAFRRGMSAGQQLGFAPVESAGAAVLVLSLVRALTDGDQNLIRIAASSIEQLDRWGVDDGLRGRLEFLAENARAAEKLPLEEALATLGGGSSSAAVVTRALYLTWRFGPDGRAELHASSVENGSTTAVACGLLTGARHGSGAFPLLWRRKLATAQKIEELSSDLFEKFGTPEPAGAAPAEPTPVDAHERFVGSMLAGAMGDALGFGIEFHDIPTIRRNHGGAGLTSPVLRDGVAQVSDDTQMMLFTLEGLIRAHVARRINPTDNDPVPEVQHAYQRWFHTQDELWERCGGPYAQHLQQPDGWLITNSGLFGVRAPSSTCRHALANFARTHQHATPQFKINDSKGRGGVMRAAPVAVWSNDPAEVFYAAVGTAALTHGHPSGYLSAGVLAVIVHQLIRDVSLPESVRMARGLLLRWRGHEEQLQVLDAAVELAKKGPASPEELNNTLGHGRVGEEALAIGLYAVLATDNLRDALLLAVNHSGSSPSTGIVCGNIAGALYGARAIPQEWLSVLELRELVETLAKDALVEFSPGPPTDQSWTQRYPAW
ncbi:ADP-ribosylglycohydrolase [Saccharopolyspora shandongensis]|uniref:ADP-ribosylglycohydrolase n=1 Tax=Saccharopolyspora shandongensis TaxID=418495 RepID=A0A1H3C1C9_9PSEU|nr:ADP-ribosylglycohydrolase [Saccharopolyspora shandongensis]